METSNCRSCNAPIIWVRSATTNNLMPVDAEPVPDGNIVLIDGLAHILKGDLFEDMSDKPKHKSHFATCADAAKYRKPKEKK